MLFSKKNKYAAMEEKIESLRRKDKKEAADKIETDMVAAVRNEFPVGSKLAFVRKAGGGVEADGRIFTVGRVLDNGDIRFEGSGGCRASHVWLTKVK